MRRVLFLLSLSVVTAACAEDHAPVSPSGPVTPFVLSGTVYEHGPFGQRPVPNFVLEVAGDSGYLSPQRTDDGGRYRFSLTTPDVALRARATGFVQPCSATAVVTGDTTLDVHIVPDSVLVTSGIPSSMPIVEPQISGRVFERTASGDRPVIGARVHSAFKVGRWDWSEVVTATDASGRYLLCGVKDKTSIYATTSGYTSKDATVDLNRTTTYDLELLPGEF